MNLCELFMMEAPRDDYHIDYDEADLDKNMALARETGFFGAQGAGCIFLATDTGRFLLAHRSRNVQEPNTWGSWGGVLKDGESPVEAAKQEAYEECHYSGPMHLVPLLVFEAKKGGRTVFQFHNFLAVVDHEFKPDLNWESQGYAWVEFGQFPSPLHFGVQAVLNDAESVSTIRSIIEQSVGHSSSPE